MTHSQQVRRVLLITFVLNIVVAAGKIILGMVTGALAISADGFHSLVDGASNINALVMNRLAERPPDHDHPYGHRRFETVGALVIGIMLLLTAWELLQSAGARLFGSGHLPEVNALTLGVLFTTLIINIGVTTYEHREGVRLRSELLTADAAHTRADVYVTLSVIASTVFVMAGIQWADTIAALVVVGLIVRAATQVLRQSGRVLVDTAPYTAEQLTMWTYEISGVESVMRARSRGTTDAAYVDIDLEIDPSATTTQTEAIASAVRTRISEQIQSLGGDAAEVTVYFSPRPGAEPGLAQRTRAHADALGISTHEVTLQQSEAGPVLHLHVEVPSGQTLQEAHDVVTALETALRDDMPNVAEIVTHIEPILCETPMTFADSADHTQNADLCHKAYDMLLDQYPKIDWHALRAYRQEGGYALSLHAGLDPSMSIESAHSLSEAVEVMLLSNLTEVSSVTIHTEPVKDRALS